MGSIFIIKKIPEHTRLDEGLSYFFKVFEVQLQSSSSPAPVQLQSVTCNLWANEMLMLNVKMLNVNKVFIGG